MHFYMFAKNIYVFLNINFVFYKSYFILLVKMYVSTKFVNIAAL